MRRIERQITIDAPAAKVFSYLADFPRHVEWAEAAHRLQIQQTSPGPVGVGSTFASVGHEMGEHRAQVTVTELVPNNKIVFQAEDDTGRFRHYFLLQEEGGGTRLAKGIELLKLSLLRRLLSPLAKLPFLVPRELGGDLKRIKAKLEG